MAEAGYSFRQNGIGDRLAVGDDAVESKIRAPTISIRERFRGRAFNMRPGMKGLAQLKTVEHFPLRCVSAVAPRHPAACAGASDHHGFLGSSLFRLHSK